MTIALIVPVLSRFDLFTDMMSSVDVDIRPYVIDNWNENRGVSGAWNLGMLRAYSDGYKYALICNDDIKFTPNAIRSMHNLMLDTGACLVSPNQNGGGDVNSAPQEGGADFFCFMVDIPKLINNCGLFDENFRPAYFEDNDMHRRMQLAGVLSYILPNAIVMHHGSATQNFNPSAPACPPAQFENNRNYFVNKWGGEPGRETFDKPFNDPSKSIKDWN